MNRKEIILIIGCGELGGILLEYLCRIPRICKIIVADSDAERGVRKVNSSILGASYMGLFPEIVFKKLDILNTERTAEYLREVDPTIIYNGTTLQSWWVVNELPPEINKKIYSHRCGLGPWEACHLALTYKIMQAVKMSGIEAHVINTSFPDVTNPSLAKIGLAPTVGIGNMDLTIPYIQKAASEILNVPMSNIKAVMIGHHFHCYTWCRAGTGADAPHYLKIYLNQEDVTEKLMPIEKFVAQLPQHAIRPGGRGGQYLVAASSMKNILAILNDTNEVTHAPGPQGLEGGYPVRLNREGAEVLLPKGMTLEEARKINQEAQQYDGVLEIRDNGDVILTDEAHQNFKELFGYDNKVITIEDSYDQAMELRSKLRELLEKCSVELPR